MKYQAPYGSPGGPNDTTAVYINGNPSTGTMGSIPPAASIEYPQREIVNLIASGGLTSDDGDLHQLSRAVQGGLMIYGVDAGTATAYEVTLDPPVLSYTDGLAVWMLPANSNSGPATLSVNGLVPRNIVRRGGALLSAGDMPQGYKSLLTYNALHSNFELYGTGFTAGGFMPVLTANTVLYVNGSTGDDTLYDGTTATISGPHGPFKTITRAMTETFKYGPSLYTMTINIAAGTYNEACQTPALQGPTIIINGAGATNTFVTGATDTHTFLCGNGNSMYIQNICGSAMLGSFGPPSVFFCYTGSSITTNNTASGSAIGFTFWCAGGTMWIGNHTFNANSAMQSALYAGANGSIGLLGPNRTAPVFTMGGPITVNGFAATNFGAISVTEAPYQVQFVNPGLVTGSKYNCTLNGVIWTEGQTPSFFPGTTPGTVSTGGQYL